MNNLEILKDKTVIVTGGAGLLGAKHIEAISEIGGKPIIFDLNYDDAIRLKERINKYYNNNCEAYKVDIANENQVRDVIKKIIYKNKKIDVLINNAALNPKIESSNSQSFTRLENYSVERWNKEISVGLTGAFICSKLIGSLMAKEGKGVIINISSDLGIISPDQRIYRKKALSEKDQIVKPVSYSVIKHGIIGLTKYLATYWPNRGVRSNALCPGGIQNNQDKEFISKVSKLIPLGRMAKEDEYKSAIQFLCSDQSSYMNGACLVMDGGRSAW